jgi:hypothetical protein
LTGKPATRATNRITSKPDSDFNAFLTAMFEALDIFANTDHFNRTRME